MTEVEGYAGTTAKKLCDGEDDQIAQNNVKTSINDTEASVSTDKANVSTVDPSSGNDVHNIDEEEKKITHENDGILSNEATVKLKIETTKNGKEMQAEKEKENIAAVASENGSGDAPTVIIEVSNSQPENSFKTIANDDNSENVLVKNSCIISKIATENFSNTESEQEPMEKIKATTTIEATKTANIMESMSMKIMVDDRQNERDILTDENPIVGETKMLVSPKSPSNENSQECVEKRQAGETQEKVAQCVKNMPENGMTASIANIDLNDSVITVGDDDDEPSKEEVNNEETAVQATGDEPNPHYSNNISLSITTAKTAEKDPLNNCDADADGDDESKINAEYEENLDNKLSISLCSDSDGAVIINSDSESETSLTTPKSNSKQQNQSPTLPFVTITATKTPITPTPVSVINSIDDDDDHKSEEPVDDDDDCVVVEHETTAPPVKKRKSSHLDNGDSDPNGSQPPLSKRRNGPSLSAMLSLRNARALLQKQQKPNRSDLIRRDVTNIFPLNKTADNDDHGNDNNNNGGLPKLVPMSTSSISLSSSTATVAAANAMIMGNGNIGAATNATLLPGLTDDMFVLEAPSFIVPYIYEKPPSDSLKLACKEIEMKFKLTREDLADADKSDEFDMMTEQNKDEKDSKTTSISKIPSKTSPGSDKKNDKKRRRGADDPDESWSEDSSDDDDDDDDDSDAGMRTKVLIQEATDDLTALKGAIKPASAVVQSTSAGSSASCLTTTSASGIGCDMTATTKTANENYFESPVGKFFMDIGVGLVQEYVQADLIRLQKRKMRKSLGKNLIEFERAITALSGNLEASRKKNAPFKFTLKRCEFCNFKSESALAMANHYETPHMNGIMYKCNFCTYEIRNATEIVYHMEAIHNIKARLIKPLPYHQCPNCGFEDNGKAKLARHQPVCAKKFRPEINLIPPSDWEAPAKIPRIKPRHGLVGTATAYQAMAAQAAAQKAALASIQQQQHVAQSRTLQAAALAAQNANKIRGRPPVPQTLTRAPTFLTVNNNTGGAIFTPNILRTGTQAVRQPTTANSLPNHSTFPISHNSLIQQSVNAIAKKALSGQPSISITPLPRQNAAGIGNNNSSFNNKVSGASSSAKGATNATGASSSTNSTAVNNKAQYVICEICDGYIKDLDQLRNHMQWMHKVKIHPKMIYNRPPLNCQKCQFRFFTDQGLERHLLGSHGLVTSSMQEAANKGKDAGRCPVCGRMYQWKLLNHVSREHHMTLKPAHLSYKCTVCTATFGMYKQFETHVYTAHSTVAKKAMDGKKNNNNLPSSNSTQYPKTSMSLSGVNLSTLAANITAASTSSNIMASNQLTRNNNLSSGNDALLKPLKINDEITIIPQPSTKPRIMNTESHVID